MMLLGLHIVGIAALIGISCSLGYQFGIKEGLKISRKEISSDQNDNKLLN